MKTHFFTLLLLFTSSVIALGADRVVFRAVPTAEQAAFPFQVGLLDSTIDPNKQTAPANHQSQQPGETRIQEYYSDADLYLSSSEKFDSSFGESIVLHLVTQTCGKARPDAQAAKFSGSPSLRRLNIMLQV